MALVVIEAGDAEYPLGGLPASHGAEPLAALAERQQSAIDAGDRIGQWRKRETRIVLIGEPVAGLETVEHTVLQLAHHRDALRLDGPIAEGAGTGQTGGMLRWQIAANTASSTCPLGILMAPQAAIAAVTVTDMVVSDRALTVDANPRGRGPREAAWSRQHYQAGSTLCSVCTRSLLLTDAGLLDGDEANSHWGLTNLFMTYYPRSGCTRSVSCRPLGRSTV